MTFTPPESGTYYARVSGDRDETGSYTLSVTEVPPEPPARPTGVIGASSQDLVKLFWTDPQDGSINGYRIMRREPRADDSGQFVAVNEDTGSGETTYTDDTVEPDRVYVYQVRAIGSGGVSEPSRDVKVRGNTEVGQGFREGATDLPADATTSGVVVVDGFGARGAIHEPIHRPDNYRDLDTDWFAVELKTGRTYRIDMKGAILVAPGTYADDELTLFLPQINAIYDADGDYLFNTWSRDESSAHHLFRVTFHAHADGTYYIAASGESFEAGGYELRVIDITRDADEHAADPSTTGTVAVGGSTTGKIDFSGDRDWFKVTLAAGTEYQVDLEGQDTGRGSLRDPVLRGIFDADGNEIPYLRDDDGGGAGSNARVTFTPGANGVYYVAAGSFGDYLEGTYTLSVKEVVEEDDDGTTPVAVTVEFGAASYTATEGGTAATVTVNLSADPERSVTIPIVAAGAGGAGTGDYSLSATSVTIAGSSTSATFTVTATDDSVDDDGESVNLSFGTLPDEVSPGTQSTATVNLTDNDHPQVTAQFGAATYTATEGGSAVTVTVNLSADPERSVTIPIVAAGADGAGSGDYSLSATSVTIASGSTSATFTVTASDDSVDDDDESVTLSFGTLPDEVSPGTQSTATVNLTDNDHPQVTAEFGAATYTATEGGSAVTVTVNLSADPERSVIIPIVAAGADGAGSGDYSLSATSVTIDSGDTSATFTVTAVDDSVDDDGESVNLAFGTLPDRVSPGTQSTATVNLTETDSTSPSASSAQVSADGTTIDIVFDEDLDATGSAPAATAFKVTVDGGTPVTPDNVDFHASDADTFTLTMAAADAIVAGATVTVAYDKPEDNPLKDAAGNEVATFTGQAAANRLDAPAEVRAYAGNGRVEVEWDAPASGDAPSGYQVQWKAPSDGAYDATRSATVVAGVTEYAITGLTNGDSYEVAVRALDDSNNLVNEAAESPEVTVGQPKAVADLTAAGRHKDFRVDWDAPDERGEGFAQDDEGNPALVYRVSWMQASETAQVRCLTATAANRFKDGTSNPGDGDTYQIKVEARFETDPAVDESVTGCADQTGFGPESSTSATVGRAMTGDSDHAALQAGLEAAVTVREQQQPWMRTAWEQLKTAPFLGVQAKDRDRDDYGVFHSQDCTLSSETFETDALDSCESGKFQMDVDWDLMPDEEFEYILARELGQTWFYNTGIHDAQSRSPVGRALLYFSQQDFKGDDSKHIVCTFDAMADVIAHVAVGTPSTALGSYGTACFTDGRTEPAQLTEEVVVHALHPSGADPDGNDTTSSWFTDTYATGAEAWAAVESITPREQKDPPDPLVFPWSRGMVVILLQDEFGGYCSALVANGAAFGTDFFDNVGGGNDVTDPWNTFGCEPGAPTGVTVSEPNSQKIIDVAWTAPTKSGAPITDYTVQWRTTTQTWAQANSQTIDASPPEFQISVNPSERYVVRVRAVNSIGDGEWGAEVTSDAADDDANLTALSVDGTSVEDFDKDTTGYSLSVAGTVARVTFVAAASHDDATVAYSVNADADADADSVTDGHQVDLDGGSNEVVITVTAQDGTTTKDYTVTVHRAAVPHDWSLRPEGVPIGGMFRLLFITSTTRDGWGTDIDPYDAHVQSALAADGAHEDIRDYSPWFKALAGVADGTDPRTHTGTHPVDDGSGVAIWWLNGPLAAADNDDFYEYDRANSSFCSRADDDDCYDGWAHSDPAYLESGEAKNFISSQAAGNTTSLFPNAFVWTGTGPNGERAPSKHLGSSGGIQASTYGVPDDNESVWSDPFPNDEGIGLSLNNTLGLYGLSDTLYVEPPDAPYATVAAITSTPANGTDYRAGETITATVTFSEAVEVDTTSGTPSLGLGIGSNTRDADYQSIDSTGTVLTFAYPVVGDDEDLDGIAVAMGALKLNGGAITGATGDHNGVAAALTHAAITADENQKVDGDLDATAPAVDSAKVSTDGMSIDIVFDEDLDATGSEPAALAFQVTVGTASAVNPSSVDFHATAATTVVLTMGTAIAAGETVSVAYTKPASNALADAASNKVATFTGQAAPNRPAAPAVSLTAGDGKLTATWAAPANGGSTITHYDVEWKTAAQTWDEAATAGQSDTATSPYEITGLTNGIEHTVRVRAANAAGDGPWSAEASETPMAADTTAPSASSAKVSADGMSIDIVFDEDLDSTVSAPAADVFDVTVDGGTAVNPTSVDFHATAATTVVLTMTTAIAAGETVSVAYTKPASNALADAASNEVESFTGTDAIAAPNRPAAPVVTLTAGNGKLTATWAAPANGGSAITGYTVEHKVAGAADSTYVAVTRADAAALTETITGLTNNTEYTVRVRAGNDAGDGPWSAEASETPMAADTTAPSASAAKVSADGMSIDIVFDEDLDATGSAPAADVFDVTVDGGTAVNPTSVDFHASDADTVVLTMGSADTIAAGGTVSVAYTKPASNALADAASNKVATFTGTDAIAAPNRPAAPVVTLSAGDEKLTATWAAPANGGSAITRYDVQWKTASQTWDEAETAGQSDTATSPYEITGLTNGIEHTVRVRAANAAGDGPWSAEASETPMAADTTAPSASASKVSADGMSIDIVFDEDLDATGSAPAALAFQVTVGTASAVNPSSVDFHASDADTITLTMATADTIAAGGTVSVAYTKPASNALADAVSNEVESFTGQAAPNRPAAPVVTLSAGDEKLTATWAAPANGGSAITGYTVEHKVAGAADSTYVAVTRADAAALTETITGLTNNTEYTVRVRAGNDAGDGPWSAEASETPMAADTTAPSASAAKVSADGMSIDIVFDEDLDATGSAPAADVFDVTVDGGTAVNPTSVDFHASDADTVVLTMGSADTIAAGGTVSVAYTKPASNALADAASNKVATFTGTDAIAAPNRPAAPVVTLSAGDGKLTATWAAPANGGSAITRYDVQWKTASQTWDEAETAGQSDTATSPYEITGLTNGIEHTVRVRAANAAGDGPWSAEASETPMAADTTAPSASASKVSTDGMSIDIVFDEDLDATGSAPAALAFQVTVGTASAVNPSSVDFHASDADTITLTMATADTIAAGGTVSVAYTKPASNALADAVSNEVESFTGQAAPNRPAAPVVTLSAGDEKLTATWAAPANGGSAITGYTVEHKVAGAADSTYVAVTRADAAALTETITGLTNNTEYTVRVRAGNDAGDGPWSAEASETPMAADTTAPSASSSKVSADGMSIDIVFDEDLDSTVSAPAADVFDVTVDGGTAVNPTSVDFHASDADTITLTMATADTIAAGGTVSVAYTKPASNALADAASNKVATFTGQAAPNRPAPRPR